MDINKKTTLLRLTGELNIAHAAWQAAIVDVCNTELQVFQGTATQKDVAAALRRQGYAERNWQIACNTLDRAERTYGMRAWTL